MGHRQTVQIQIRHHIMRCLIRIFTVFLQNLQLKFGEKLKIPPNTPKIGNGLVKLMSWKFNFGLNQLKLMDKKIFKNFNSKILFILTYESVPVLSSHSKRRPKIGIQDRLSLKETNSATMNIFHKIFFSKNGVCKSRIKLCFHNKSVHYS